MNWNGCTGRFWLHSLYLKGSVYTFIYLISRSIHWTLQVSGFSSLNWSNFFYDLTIAALVRSVWREPAGTTGVVQVSAMCCAHSAAALPRTYIHKTKLSSVKGWCRCFLTLRTCSSAWSRSFRSVHPVKVNAFCCKYNASFMSFKIKSVSEHRKLLLWNIYGDI